MFQFFISYSHEDYDFATLVKLEIEKRSANDFHIWIDELTPAGEDWRKEIDDAIRESAALILVLTHTAQESKYVNYEWAFARGAGKTLVPLMLENIEHKDLHDALEGTQMLNFTGRNRPWDRLFERLQEIVGWDNESGWERLLTDLRSSRRNVREAALDTLRERGEPGDLQYVIEIVHGDSYRKDVRNIGVEALGNFGEDAIPYLIKALDDRFKEIRFKAAGILASSGSVTIPHLTRVVDTTDKPDVLRRVAWVLGDIQDDEAIPVLEELLNDQRRTYDYSKRVSDEAADALMKIGTEQAIMIVTPYWIAELQNTKRFWRNKDNMRVCDYAAQILSHIATPEAEQALDEWHKNN